MDILDRLNAAIDYAEDNLCEDINISEVSKIALYTPDGFLRMFSYLASMTFTEYVRCRRLTLAALELQNTDNRIIDLAIKYGYGSADSFSRAFVRQHSISPTAAREKGAALRIYPPISFHMMIKGAKEMEFRMVETESIELCGIGKAFFGEAGDRFPQEHVMWADHHDDIQNKVSASVPGTWYGIWDKGTYWIAKSQEEVANDGFDKVTIPGGQYAVFSTGYGGFAGDELPKLREQIFGAWLASSGYRQTRDCEIEVYHLFPKAERHKGNYEIWIPVEKVD